MPTTTSILLLFFGIVVTVYSFPYVDDASKEVGNETAKQLVLSPQEVYLLQLQQNLQQQQSVALAEANRKLLQQQQENEDTDEDDDDLDPYYRSALPVGSDQIFPDKVRKDNDDEDVVYAIVDTGEDEELREAPEESTTNNGTVAASVVTIAPGRPETASTNYVNVPNSDQPDSAADETDSNAPSEPSGASTISPSSAGVDSSSGPPAIPDPAAASSQAPSGDGASSVAPGGDSASSVAPGGGGASPVAPGGDSASSVAPGGDGASSVAPGGAAASSVAPEGAEASSVTPSSASTAVPISGQSGAPASSSVPAVSTTSTPAIPSASSLGSSPTPDSPPNPSISTTVSAPTAQALNELQSNATTPSTSLSSAAPSIPQNGSNSSDLATTTTSTTTKKPRPHPPYSANVKCRCGTQTTRRLSIGSTRVNTNTYPWTVSVAKNGTHMCTGSIINSRYVLTSASCLKGSTGEDLIIRAALSNPNKNINYTVRSVSYHPSYRQQSMAHNLALVEVEDEIEPSKSVKFVCLPLGEQRDSDCGTIVNVNEDRTSKNLTMTQQQVQKIPTNTCTNLLRRNLENDTFCTAPPSRYCGGDTGGAYITPGKGYSFTLRGLVNSSAGCKVRRQPAVFTNVTRYTSWILYKSQSGSYCQIPSFKKELLSLT